MAEEPPPTRRSSRPNQMTGGHVARLTRLQDIQCAPSRPAKKTVDDAIPEDTPVNPMAPVVRMRRKRKGKKTQESDADDESDDDELPEDGLKPVHQVARDGERFGFRKQPSLPPTETLSQDEHDADEAGKTTSSRTPALPDDGASSDGVGMQVQLDHLTETYFEGCQKVGEARALDGPSTIAVMPLSSFHTMGFQLFYPIFEHLTAAIYPPRVFSSEQILAIPSPDNVIQHMKRTRSTAAITVPAFLQAWIQSDKFGPVTEFSPPNYSRHDWEWMMLNAAVPLDWAPQGNGDFECRILLFSVPLMSTKEGVPSAGTIQLKIGLVPPPKAPSQTQEALKAKFEEVYELLVKKSRPSLVSAPPLRGGVLIGFVFIFYPPLSLAAFASNGSIFITAVTFCSWRYSFIRVFVCRVVDSVSPVPHRPYGSPRAPNVAHHNINTAPSRRHSNYDTINSNATPSSSSSSSTSPTFTDRIASRGFVP
ncbi:hypothetical protein BDN72DRAFT_877174 [Pluteus cervinus]|uniref:Uncharacterized protein n=1 Tax=Pluteus cervinus TaxID=181527 RepID=A0ACD3B149_9AGAR|nr:hypothetical protein BDN72DRAFT_877174 [Pluteus cervinus]